MEVPVVVKSVSPKLERWTDSYDIWIPGNYQEAVQLSTAYMIDCINQSIGSNGRCTLVLAGGSTPKAIYTLLSQPFYAKQVDWSKVVVFWGDERAVAPDHAESNYNMVKSTGFLDLLSKKNIHRMVAEKEIKKNAREYEQWFMECTQGVVDLLMLGVGEDGHTASLFPDTLALKAPPSRKIMENYVRQKDVWRMTFTYSAINSARKILIFAFGVGKQDIMEKLVSSPKDSEMWPVQHVGVSPHQVLWILDQDASKNIRSKIKK